MIVRLIRLISADHNQLMIHPSLSPLILKCNVIRSEIHNLFFDSISLQIAKYYIHLG
jgi:hypothetical protein